MRITPQKLWAWARHFAREQQGQPDLLAVYLSGSLLSRSPLLGGTTDIDLVCIWNHSPQWPHELRVLPAGVLLDIRHYPRTRFEPARKLRTDPWLGAEVAAAQPLWDPRHFFDRAQANVRSHFHDPEVAFRRAWELLNRARTTWMNMPTYHDLPVFVQHGLEVVYHAAHVPATLRGYVLPPRRFLQAFAVLAQMFQQPQWTATLLQVLGAPHISGEQLQAWVEPWLQTFDAALQTQPTRDPVLHPARRAYYALGVQALLQGETPMQALYPMLWTWTLAAQRLTPEARKPWEEAVQSLGWHRREAWLQQLDTWLDTQEAFLEQWGQAHGIAGEDVTVL